MWTTTKWFGFNRTDIAESVANEASELETGDLSEVSMKLLSTYTTKASNASKHRSLSTGKVDQRYAGVHVADEKIRKMEGKPSTAKVAATRRIVDESTNHEVDWDGNSTVRVRSISPSEIHVSRVKSNNVPSDHEDDQMVYTPDDDEFHQITRERKQMQSANDDHDAWREKRSAALQGRHYHESVDLPIADEERQPVQFQHYTLTVGKPYKQGEGAITRAFGHVDKMNALGVPVHDRDDYADTVSVHVQNNNTGAESFHHVYQKGKSMRSNEQHLRAISIRPIGRLVPATHEHSDVIARYLEGDNK